MSDHFSVQTFLQLKITVPAAWPELLSLRTCFAQMVSSIMTTQTALIN